MDRDDELKAMKELQDRLLKRLESSDKIIETMQAQVERLRNETLWSFIKRKVFSKR